MKDQLLSCPKCRSQSVKKNGKTQKQRFRCKRCFRQFLTDYTDQGCRRELRRLIVPMTMNGSGISDISRVLNISPNTVLKTIKEQAAQMPQVDLPNRLSDV